MGLWRRVRELSAGDRLLLAETGLLLLLTRVGLWVLPFPVLRRGLDRLRRARPEPRPDAPSRVGWAVAALARRLPGMTCLVQSLAAQALLRRRGHSAELHIGVCVARRGAVAGGATAASEAGWGSVRRGVHAPGGRALEAHAWVECEGRIVAGAADDLAAYAVLKPVGRPASTAPPASG